MRTERAVCRLLLGDMDGAEAALGLAAAADGPAAPDPAILAYIQVRPLTPCGMKLQWGLRKLAAGRFQGLRRPQPRHLPFSQIC